jgi:hypothetical protein
MNPKTKTKFTHSRPKKIEILKNCSLVKTKISILPTIYRPVKVLLFPVASKMNENKFKFFGKLKRYFLFFNFEATGNNSTLTGL